VVLGKEVLFLLLISFFDLHTKSRLVARSQEKIGQIKFDGPNGCLLY